MEGVDTEGEEAEGEDIIAAMVEVEVRYEKANTIFCSFVQ
jgi:hypothetical protein